MKICDNVLRDFYCYLYWEWRFCTWEKYVNVKWDLRHHEQDSHDLSCLVFDGYICSRRLLIWTRRGPPRSLNVVENPIYWVHQKLSVFVPQAAKKLVNVLLYAHLLACDLVSLYFNHFHAVVTDRRKYSQCMHWSSIPWQPMQRLVALWQPNDCRFF